MAPAPRGRGGAGGRAAETESLRTELAALRAKIAALQKETESLKALIAKEDKPPLFDKACSLFEPGGKAAAAARGDREEIEIVSRLR